MTDSKTIWNHAAYAGLVLGLVSTAYYTCDWMLGKFCTEGALLYLGVAAKIGLWITKLIACIVLMKFAMQRFVSDVNGLTGTGTATMGTTGNGTSHTGSWGSNSRNEGTGTTESAGGGNGNNGASTTGSSNTGCNCSVTNADTFRLGARAAFLSALLYSGFLLAFVLYIQPDIFKNTLDSLRESPMLTEAALEAAEAIAPKFPAITFFSNFIYCTLFGTALSAILSHNIPSTNPFKN